MLVMIMVIIMVMIMVMIMNALRLKNSGHRGVQIHLRAWPPGVDSSQQQPLHAEHQGAKNSEHCLLFVNTKNIRLLRIVPFLRRLSTT